MIGLQHFYYPGSELSDRLRHAAGLSLLSDGSRSNLKLCNR
jgi:hypothetical protein